jgi:hypothetical protein
MMGFSPCHSWSRNKTELFRSCKVMPDTKPGFLPSVFSQDVLPLPPREKNLHRKLKPLN